MTSPGPAETIHIPDLELDPLVILAAVASTVLNAHTNEAGLCVVCGSTWPSQRAVLAEHNLASL